MDQGELFEVERFTVVRFGPYRRLVVVATLDEARTYVEKLSGLLGIRQESGGGALDVYPDPPPRRTHQ